MPDEQLRGRPPRVPEPTEAVRRERAVDDAYRQDREAMERRSLVRGLVLLALVVLVMEFARAGLGRVFVPGWWRQW
jgi:hypothetical protein